MVSRIARCSTSRGVEEGATSTPRKHLSPPTVDAGTAVHSLVLFHWGADGIDDGTGRTDCMQVVHPDEVVRDPELVTCPMCKVVMRARAAGKAAKRAIQLGQDSGIFDKPPSRGRSGKKTGNGDRGK